jgi:S-methylmethionine-dependent homocysteine/selenocysteine methylase
MVNAFRQRLERGAPLVLDAAMGTELSRRGANTAPPLWSARALVETPELVEKVHRENVAAGAEILTIASFRLHGRNLRDGSCSISQGELIATAVALARHSMSEISSPPSKKFSSRVWIAGSLAPLEDCYEPARVPKQENILSSEHSEMAAALAAQGVDLILVETMNSIRELVAATAAAVSTGLPVLASIVTEAEGRLLSGEPISDAARALLSLSPPPDALGINCVPARRIGGDLAWLRAAAPGIPLVVYGNAGRALDEAKGLFTEPIDPYEYAALARGWLGAGARVVGGCCGTNAAHVLALRALLDEGTTTSPRPGR